MPDGSDPHKRATPQDGAGTGEARDGGESEQGREIIKKLRAGELPQMVDWFDPGLLAKVGMRSIISATLGSYTDQRLMQAATDNVKTEDLKKRYDYSETGDYKIEPDDNGAVWGDYIADLGDGFESTYAMAYLMAADKLKVAGVADPLPAGKLLIMGGDQVYPDATPDEYDARLRDPYDWAFSPAAKPYRKLFAIPGNHDWYDGLSAFSSLFCSARDRISRGKGTQIGGWRCYQHRSYFAIKLPHNWWIWGPDIQLADNLDDSQRDYFDLVSERTGPGHKIILCLAEPSWLHEDYDNMHEITLLARQYGAKICAVIAGDWHHYSRYTDAETVGGSSEKLNVQFVTCGGGGAFAHATHGLKPSIELLWAPAAVEADHPDSVHERKTIANPHPSAPAPDPKPSADLDAGARGFKSRKRRDRTAEIAKKANSFTCEAKMIHPPRATSRLLCLKNLALPFHNRPFTYLVGLVYFVYAWAFAAADPRSNVGAIAFDPQLSTSEQMHKLAGTTLSHFLDAKALVMSGEQSPMFAFMLLGLWAGLVYYVESKSTWVKLLIGSLHATAHIVVLLFVSWFAQASGVIAATLGLAAFKQGMPSEIGTLLQSYLASESSIIPDVLRILWTILVSLFFGGLLGGFVMGLYWTLTSTLLSMHTGDAFGALGIRDYKHFLRIKLEEDRATIYPIGLDHVPGPSGWRAEPREGEARPSHDPQIMPSKPLEPRLIEPPIMIEVSKVGA